MPDQDPFVTEAGTQWNAEVATIDPRQVTDYALNPNHPVGGHKARVFERVLELTLANEGELLAQVRAGILTAPARPRKVDRSGNRFTVDLVIQGPNGVQSVVTTEWTYDPGSSVPRLITLFIPQGGAMRRARLFDTVRLTRDLAEHGLSAGKVGAVVEEYDAPDEASEVEFLDNEGYTVAVCALTPVELPWGAPVAHQAAS
jgi:hypothetical protein